MRWPIFSVVHYCLCLQSDQSQNLVLMSFNNTCNQVGEKQTVVHGDQITNANYMTSPCKLGILANLTKGFNLTSSEVIFSSRYASKALFAVDVVECITCLHGDSGFINSVAFSADGTRIVSGSEKSIRM